MAKRKYIGLSRNVLHVLSTLLDNLTHQCNVNINLTPLGVPNHRRIRAFSILRDKGYVDEREALGEDNRAYRITPQGQALCDYLGLDKPVPVLPVRYRGRGRSRKRVE